MMFLLRFYTAADPKQQTGRFFLSRIDLPKNLNAVSQSNFLKCQREFAFIVIYPQIFG
jgi:hypothetical protein